MMPTNSFLLAAWGGPGNTGPMLTAARRLRRRGHTIRIIGEPEMHDEALEAGFKFTPWRHAPSYQDVTVAMAQEPTPEIQTICKHVMFGGALAYADEVAEELARAPVDAVLVHDILIGAALAAEAAGLPCAMLSPHISLRP